MSDVMHRLILVLLTLCVAATALDRAYQAGFKAGVSGAVLTGLAGRLPQQKTWAQ